MEVTINIPQNDYVQPTEVRQEVVQEICNLLLEGQEIAVFENAPSRLSLATMEVTNGSYKVFLKTKKDTKERRMSHFYDHDDLNVVRVRGVEVQAAFDVLLNANYYIHGRYKENMWEGNKHTYKCSKTPYINGNKCSVTKFDLFID